MRVPGSSAAARSAPDSKDFRQRPSARRRPPEPRQAVLPSARSPMLGPPFPGRPPRCPISPSWVERDCLRHLPLRSRAFRLTALWLCRPAQPPRCPAVW